MLSTTQHKLLQVDFSIFLITICIVGVLATYSSDFVTKNGTLTDELPLEAFSDVKMSSSLTPLRAHPNFEQRYKLRFKPLQAMPRLFWHKFPKPQVEAPQPPATSSAAPEPEPTEPAETVAPETETPPEEELPTPTQPPVVVTSMKPIASSTSRAPTLRPSSTLNTIMKPLTPLKPHFGSTLKNLLLFGSPNEANLIQKQPTAIKTKSKGFLSLFEVIKFDNNKCSVSMSDIRSMEGVCYHEFECKSLGGIPTERCAEGVGVCCIFLTGCGEATQQPVVYFESPNYPNPVHEMLICVLIVNVRDKVQQLRLDFLMFELNRPTNGDCLDDQFIVSGQNMNFVVPIICGINTGQHMYIDVAHSFENKVYLSFFAKVPSGGRSFNIKVTQLESDLAPDGCLQYYTEPEGVVKSFNYDTDGSIVGDKEATYLNNLNYAICIQRAKDTCTVSYATEQQGGEQLDFQIINKDEDENDLLPDGQAGAGIFNCPDDYIAINQVRLCGERFNDGVESEDFTMHAVVKDVAAGPIILPVRSDIEFVGRGFRLVYKQELCI